MNQLLTFIMLSVFWLIWSGMFDGFHITLGVISVGLVVAWTGNMIMMDNHQPVGQRLMQWWRFEIYSFWLLWQIVLANIDVMKLAFHPKLSRMIQPKFMTFKTTITGDVPLFVLAQSITLTPGTVTLAINGQVIEVHALHNAAADALPGDMARKVEAIFKVAA